MQVAKVPDGEYLLQNAANSVLGKQLIALCKKRGIKTINMVRQCLFCTKLCYQGEHETLATLRGNAKCPAELLPTVQPTT